MKNRVLFGILAVSAVLVMTAAGCSSMTPISTDILQRENITAGDSGKYQYFISRDILLTPKNVPGTAAQSVSRDVIQITSAMPGRIVEIKKSQNGNTMLGVSFEQDRKELLWFIQQHDGDFFNLAYTDDQTGEMDYGGRPYMVSWMRSGSQDPKTSFRRANPFRYENMPPMLLYK